MVINHEYKLVFFHIPKTGGTSIRTMLSRHPASVMVDKPTKHLMRSELIKVVPADSIDIVRSYFSFCIVRNPLERFCSLHRFMLKTGRHVDVPNDLNAFALALQDRAPWLMRMRAIIPQSSFAEGCSFVGRFEKLEADLVQVLHQIGVPNFVPKMKYKNRTDAVPKQELNERSQAIVADFYRDDMQKFGYT